MTQENKFIQETKKDTKPEVKKQESKKEAKGSLQDKVMTLDEIRAEERRLQTLRVKLESEHLQRNKEIKVINDFNALTPKQREDFKAYYEIIDRRDMNDPELRKLPYEYNGQQVSSLFGKENNIRNAFFEGKLGSSYDFENRLITFLYFEYKE